MTLKPFLAAVAATRKKFDWLRFLNRIVAIAILLYSDKTFIGAVPTFLPGKTGTELLGALGLVASMAPGTLKATGLFRPASPGETSALQDVLAFVDSVITSRKEKKAQTKTQAALNLIGPLLAPLIAKELDKSWEMNAAALAAGIATKQAQQAAAENAPDAEPSGDARDTADDIDETASNDTAPKVTAPPVPGLSV